MEKESVKAYSPLVLAYLGDAVYELEIRRKLVLADHSRPAQLSARASRLVCAAAQSKMVEAILPLLDEEEEAVYRRGRNAHSPTMPKNQTVGDYRRATGFEALIGYLYLLGETGRLGELIRAGLEGLSDETPADKRKPDD